MATLNPQSLVTLWQIEQYGSFSATAKATGWSQPAISQQIKKLEAQCGSTLVQRTSHGVELTATGSMLARHGEAIADRLERAAREVEDYRHHRFDHLHLVAPPSICSTIAARTVVKLSMFTDIELSLIQMEPPEAIGLISQGKADTAAVFRYSSIPNFLHIGDDLTFHSLGYDPMRLLVRRSSGIAQTIRGDRRTCAAVRRQRRALDRRLPHLPRKFGETGRPCRIQAGYPPLHG